MVPVVAVCVLDAGAGEQVPDAASACFAGKRFLEQRGTNTTGHCIPLAWWTVMIRTASGFA